MLPKTSVLKFSVVLPESGKEVQFKPWLVGEKKAILIALQENDPVALRKAVFDVLRSCILTPDVKIETLPAQDLTYLMLHVRARSDNDVISLAYRIPPSQCDLAKREIKDSMSSELKERIDQFRTEGCVQKLKVKIDQIELEKTEKGRNKIMITDTIGVRMKPPTLEHTQMYFSMQDQNAEETINSYFDIIAACIECVFDGDQVFLAHEVPPAELRAFLDQLTDTQFAKIEEWFTKLPQLVTTAKWTCEMCGREFSRKFRGVRDFFGSATSMTA